MFRKRKKDVSGAEGEAEREESESSASDPASAEVLDAEVMDNPEQFEDLAVPEAVEDAAAGVNEASSLGNAEVERLRAEIRENYDKYLRAVADLENVKKRAIKERSDLIKYAGESLAKDVVDVLDDIERAIAADTNGTLEDFLKGVSLIRDRFVTILEQHSIKGKSGLGTDFDPLVHQALASVPTADHPPGKVIQEFKKAYYFKDKLLRPGQVVVSAAPANSEASEASQENAKGDG